MVLHKQHGVADAVSVELTEMVAAGEQAATEAAQNVINMVGAVSGIEIISAPEAAAPASHDDASSFGKGNSGAARSGALSTCARAACSQVRAALLTRAATCLIATACFVALFAGIFAVGEGWGAVDSIYFVIVTISTVGYGDLSPSSVGTRYLAVAMILLGVCFIFPLLASGVESMLGPATRAARRALGRAFPLHQVAVDLDGDGEDDYSVPQHTVLFYGRNLLPSLALNLLVQLSFSAIFTLPHVAGLHYSHAMYYCLVTATTVGYGDVSITTNAGRVTACFHIVLSVVLLAELLGTVDKLREERREQLARVRQLERRLDGAFYEQLVARATGLRDGHGGSVGHPQPGRNLTGEAGFEAGAGGAAGGVSPTGGSSAAAAGRDERGLSEIEFTLANLIELEIVTWEQVRPFIRQFRGLDVNGDGRLSKEDLKVQALAAAQGNAALAMKLPRVEVRRDAADESSSPLDSSRTSTRARHVPISSEARRADFTLRRGSTCGV